ncbi:Uncharacterised protein [uncultured archaeon]|nr:Uncharacterised protein [uncultured archaeon]
MAPGPLTKQKADEFGQAEVLSASILASIHPSRVKAAEPILSNDLTREANPKQLAKAVSLMSGIADIVQRHSTKED